MKPYQIAIVVIVIIGIIFSVVFYSCCVISSKCKDKSEAERDMQDELSYIRKFFK